MKPFRKNKKNGEQKLLKMVQSQNSISLARLNTETESIKSAKEIKNLPGQVINCRNPAVQPASSLFLQQLSAGNVKHLKFKLTQVMIFS